LSTYRLTYKIEMLDNERDAEQITRFLLSDLSFDDQRHTPGELLHFQQHPSTSLHQVQYHYWYVRNPYGDIIGVLSGFENEQQTGGFVLDYIAVHRSYRKQGIATHLILHMFDFVKALRGRYILTYTCDLIPYIPIQQLFEHLGFLRIGFYPDYYYEGEGRITYFYKM